MADLRIVDAPEIPTNSITGQEKLPTGGSGNYSITLDSVADYTKTKKDLADNTSVDTKVNGVRQELDAHTEDLLNPHQVTKGQIGLGNVDDTADLDKPVSNSTQSAIISGVAPKADKSYVDSQDSSLQSQINQKATAEYVDNALSNLSTVASKFYPTLAEANSDIANITANQVVNIGEVANGGLWYKATTGATTLTKSAYDPLTQAKSYTDDKDLILQNQINLIPKTSENEKSKSDLDGFYGQYQNGLLVDATQESDIQVLSVTNGVKAYSSIDEFYPTAFPSAKIVVGKSGNWEFSKHNIFVRTDDLTVTSWVKTGLSVGKGQRSIKGNLSANLLTTTATTANIKQNTLTIGNNRDVCASVIIKPIANVTHAYLMLATGVNVVFDLVAKTVVSLGSASTANMQDLGDGYFKLSAVFNVVTASVGVGISDNSSIVATKTGLTAIIEQMQLNMGGLTQEYLENSSTTVKYMAGFDYSKGKRTLLVETQRTYRGTYSEDFTQAAWVKTGLTAALTATSPLNTLCSRLTATTNDATVLQTITQTVLRFSIFIKRVTGSGSVSVTVDNGATWQDITSQLSTSKYTRIVVDGSGKTYGLKMATSGDVLDVCLANAHDRVNTLSPAQIYAAAPIFAVDNIPEIAIDGEVTAYHKAYQTDFNGTQNNFQPLRMTGIDGALLVPYVLSQGTTNANISVRQSTALGLKNKVYAQAATWMEVESTSLASISKNRFEVQVNGEYSASLGETLGKPTLNSASLSVVNSGSHYLDKFLIVKQAIDNYDISTWRYSKKRYNEHLVNVCTIAKEGEIPATDMFRAPMVTVLSDSGDYADLLVVFGNKLAAGIYHDEAPNRIVQRKVRYNKSLNSFTYLTEIEVLYEHEGWSESQGHSYIPAIAKIKSGAESGRLLAVFTKSDGVELTPRNLYMMHNDSNGDAAAWTSPVKIFDAQADFSVSDIISAADGSIVVYPANHPLYPNRIITPVYNLTWFATIYSDDNGKTWQKSDRVYPTTVVNSLSEPSICYLPNGNLLISTRNESSSRLNFLSQDGGLTWTEIGAMVDFKGANVSANLVQLDPTGRDTVTKPNGDVLMLISGYVAGGTRTGLSVNFIDQDLKTIRSRFYAINDRNYVGYLRGVPIFENKYLAVSFEGGNFQGASFNSDNSSYLAIIKV